MLKGFIEVHAEGKPRQVQISQITYIEINKEGNTYINFSGTECYFGIDESYDEVCKLIAAQSE